MLYSFAFTTLLALAPAPATLASEAEASEPGCTLRPTYGTPVLTGDVTDQVIVLTASGKCDALQNGTVLFVNSTDSTRRSLATVGSAPGGEGKRTLSILSSIAGQDDPTKAISSAWNVFADESSMTAGGKAIAQVFITPVSVTLKPKTTVVYRDAVLTEIASQAKPPGVAYVVPNGKNLPDGSSELTNVASLGIPETWPVEKWTITSSDVILLNDDKRCESPCRVESPQVIEFRARRVLSRPLMATIRAERPKDGEMFTIAARLAESVENSSVPLSIADIAYVLCQKDVRIGIDDVIRDNQLAAVTNSAVTNGRCKVVVSEEDINWAIVRHHGLPNRRHWCNSTYRKSRGQYRGVEEAQARLLWEEGEVACKERRARDGEEITILAEGTKTEVNKLKALYGQQRVTVFAYVEEKDKQAKGQQFLFPATLKGRREVAIDFMGEVPSPDRPIHVDIAVQPVADDKPVSADLSRWPERRYQSTLRPKGPFGITHWPHSLGSKGFRIFATVPVDFAAVRFPAAGLDIQSTRDSSRVQLSTLTTGLLLTFEPWDYTRGVNALAVPMRGQFGMLVSNWYKAAFEPSLYAGGGVTLPVIKGTAQTDIDLVLGFGVEYDLRNGYERERERFRGLVTIGLNVFSLFGPKSAPRTEKK